ncbi:MAG: DUF2171 domain-containing protein, partial [Thermomicrobiaceae bacterium]|nr:DUF2171 domain-containing protein [Thermomicrobiaceae bacterium]
MANERARIHAGMEVVGSDGQRVGTVTETRERDVRVSREIQGQPSDVFVPLDAVARVDDDRLVLTLPAADVDLQNWPHEGAATVGAVSSNPGPAGGGMPSGRPGWPTFESVDSSVPQPGAGASNLTSDQEAGARGTAAPTGLPGT